jgi:Histidine kinase-, DNA gyrase B-, and HSP90-like ATPase
MSDYARRAPASITPSAARLTESLRDIGYDFPTAIADLVDNSIAAKASRIDILIEFDGIHSRIYIADDGVGMTESDLIEALRFGSRRDYAHGDLGRYGLGLKTASLSQCRRFSVVTRHAPLQRRIAVRQLDLDRILRSDQWLVIDPGATEPVERACDWLDDGPGTVVIWESLDRVLPEKRPDGGWARRRLEGLARRTVDHLGMVFHRFVEGTPVEPPITITLNGEKVPPWDPFAPREPARINLPDQVFELAVGEVVGGVQLRRTVLPPRDHFSSIGEFERLSGPMKWNRQQGLYIYRANRLVQWGGWNGLRAIDEHTKLARASLDFDTDLDEAFNINVAKMRVSVAPQLKQMLDRPIHELCIRADDAYRNTSQRHPRSLAGPFTERQTAQPNASFGLALRAAAMQAGEYEALKRILELLKETAPEAAQSLGLDQ